MVKLGGWMDGVGNHGWGRVVCCKREVVEGEDSPAQGFCQNDR